MRLNIQPATHPGAFTPPYREGVKLKLDAGSRRFPNLALILDVFLRASNMIACNQEKQWLTCPKLR